MGAWQQVTGYEGLYEVSSSGEVASLINGRKLLKPLFRNGSEGYSAVTLYKDKKPKMFSIHRLVAEAFIENPEDKLQVNHINGNKHDNNVENLEWVTASENGLHAYETGLNNVPTERKRKVVRIDKNGVTVVFESVSEASVISGVKRYHIYRVCKGERKSAGGYSWEYIDEKESMVV